MTPNMYAVWWWDGDRSLDEEEEVTLLSTPAVDIYGWEVDNPNSPSWEETSFLSNAPYIRASSLERLREIWEEEALAALMSGKISGQVYYPVTEFFNRWSTLRET